jgi:hypothetical protein
MHSQGMQYGQYLQYKQNKNMKLSLSHHAVDNKLADKTQAGYMTLIHRHIHECNLMKLRHDMLMERTTVTDKNISTKTEKYRYIYTWAVPQMFAAGGLQPSQPATRGTQIQLDCINISRRGVPVTQGLARTTSG